MAVPPKFPVLVRWKSLRRISTRPSTGLSTAIHIRWPSGTTIRKWTQADGTAAHHLIDPDRAAPTVAGIVTATVIAADAATAEAFATAAMMLPGAEAMAMLERVQLAGLAVDDQGCVFETSTLKDFAA